MEWWSSEKVEDGSGEKVVERHRRTQTGIVKMWDVGCISVYCSSESKINAHVHIHTHTHTTKCVLGRGIK